MIHLLVPGSSTSTTTTTTRIETEKGEKIVILQKIRDLKVYRLYL